MSERTETLPVPEGVVEISEDNIREFVGGGGYISVILVTADTAVCRGSLEILQEVVEEVRSKSVSVAFGHFSFDDHEDLAGKLKVSAVPSVVYMLGNRRVHYQMALYNAQDLIDGIYVVIEKITLAKRAAKEALEEATLDEKAGITHLTDDQFGEFIESPSRLSVVDMWGPGCGPCARMVPEFRGAAEEFSGEPVSFAKLDTGQYPRVAVDCGVDKIPTILFFVAGEEVDRKLGFRSKDELVEIIRPMVESMK